MSTQAAQTGEFAAQLLRSGARAYASRAAEVVLERHPDIREAFGSGAFRRWHEHLTQRVRELAASVEMSSPEMFVSDVVWSRDAFLSRGVSVDALRYSLEALAETLNEDLPENVRPAVARCLSQGIDHAVGDSASMSVLSNSSETGRLALHYLEAAMSGDRRLAVEMLVDAYKGGTPVADLYERVLLTVEVEVGRMWHIGEVTISEEHVVTATTRTAMGILCYLASRDVAVRPGVGRVLLSTVEGDHHDLGVQAVSDLFEIAGFRTVNLGANTPASDLTKAVVDFDPSLVVLGAMMTTHVQAAREAVQATRQTKPGVPVLVGGDAFASTEGLAEKIGATSFVRSGREAVAWLDGAVSRGEIAFG
ncbi:MAG: cobalamin-dependent protein [Planctomycetota bacterium]